MCKTLQKLILKLANVNLMETSINVLLHLLKKMAS